MQEALQKLKDALVRATKGPWKVATSCSWRRIGHAHRDTPIIAPTVASSDGHPDLSAEMDDLEFVCLAVNKFGKFVEAFEELNKRCDWADSGHVFDHKNVPTVVIRDILNKVLED